jgi:hypothetical protein
MVRSLVLLVVVLGGGSVAAWTALRSPDEPRFAVYSFGHEDGTASVAVVHDRFSDAWFLSCAGLNQHGTLDSGWLAFEGVADFATATTQDVGTTSFSLTPTTGSWSTVESQDQIQITWGEAR